MEFKTFVFYFLAVIMVAAALRVITARNPVHAALFLVLTFFNAGGLWLLLQAEFLAITLVMVYVGAVMVLFLFVVMMLDINIDSLRQGFWKHFPVAGLIGAVIAVQMAFVLTRGFDLPVARPMAPELAEMANTKALGVLMYTQYPFLIQVAALILLVAMIAAIALTLRQRKDSRSQKPSEQVRVKKADRLSIVKVAPQVEVPVQPAPADNNPNGDQA